MALGAGTVNSLGAAAASLFQADAHRSRAEGNRLKGQGLRIEAGNYDRSSDYAEQNAKFTEISTEIKQSQLDRDMYKTLGGQSADVAGAGFANSGSAMDIMRDSASQGALVKAVGAQQGLITEEGYQVQAKNFTAMGEAARLAATAEDKAAEAEEHAAKGAEVAAGFHTVAALFSIFEPGSGGSSGPITLGGPGGPTPFS